MTNGGERARSPASPAGLTSSEAADVLGYWRALLRHEEALSLRPRARRPPSGPAPPLSFATPVAGQDYMKLPFAGSERFLIEQKGPLRQPLDGERLAFFEHWLAAKYRQAEEDSRVSHLALFPVLHSARDELLGLLRFPVELRWWCGQRPFEVPEPAQRRAPVGLEAPSELELREASENAGKGLPLFVDLRLLRETLRIDGDELEAFLAPLQAQPSVSGQRLVAALCELLAASIEADGEAPDAERAGPSPGAAVLLERLHRLVARRLRQLGSGQRAFPVALVVACDRSRTTWHVQRDLEQALDQLESGRLRPESPLGAYLSGRAPAGRERVCVGRWPRAPLTRSQKEALEQALGSPFTAVQGPPGTGKTTLILNLVAHQLIEKARSLLESGVMGEDFVLVTSTNNRAVDNVVEPLSSEELAELPLCLRVGHRALVEKVTARTLERLHAWLERQPGAPDALATAKQAFADALARVEARTRSVQAAQERRALLSTLEEARGELVRLGSAESRREAAARAAERVQALLHGDASARERAHGADAGWRRAPRAAALSAAALIRALDQLAELCDQDAPRRLPRVASQYARLCERQLGALSSALGAPLALAPAPAPPRSLEDWADHVASVLGPLVALEQALQGLAQTEQASERLSEVEARIAALAAEHAAEPKTLPEPDELTERADFEALFQRAIELRRAWACEHRSALCASLQAAIAQCKSARSLRSLLDSPKATGTWLRQLFPSLGCTLLSLGNALRADAPSCRRVVIDEAGQCPPAYAVSALLRAQSALVIGDTHQLEPVVGLSREDERRISRGLSLKLAAERLAPYQMFDESENSAQALADRAVLVRPSLREHFRCQPAIIALPEAWCAYGMQVCTPVRSLAARAPRLFAAALFQSCAGAQERQAGSWVNSSETEQVTAWLRYLLERGIDPSEIGVITPFRSQSEALARRLVAARIPLARAHDEEEAESNLELFGGREGRAGGVAVGTVHRFQGGERSVVLFSSTLTSTANLRFVDGRVNLLNVAVSRAREHLLVIGDEATLRAGRHTRLLVTQAERTDGF